MRMLALLALVAAQALPAAAADLHKPKAARHAAVAAPAAGDCYPDEIFPVYASPHAPGAKGHGPLKITKSEAVAQLDPGLRRVWQVTRDGWGRVLGCWVTVPLEIVTHDHGVMRQLTLDGYTRPPVIAGSLARSELARPGYPDPQVFPPNFHAPPGLVTTRTPALDPQASNWQRRYYPY